MRSLRTPYNGLGECLLNGDLNLIGKTGFCQLAGQASTGRHMKVPPGMVILALGLLSGGCATHTQTGVATGGLLGAGTGALVGHQTGSTRAGALIGGAIGAVTGGLIGEGLDENDRRNQARLAAMSRPPAVRPMSTQDVLYLTHSGVEEDTIISSIRSSYTVFELTSTDIVNLHDQGVSDRVIQAMLDTRQVVSSGAGSRPLVYERGPVYVVEPAPPPVVVGFGYHHDYHPGYWPGCW